MRQGLTIVHTPKEYTLMLRISSFAEQHVVIRTGEMQAIALDKEEVKQVIAWLSSWLSESESEREDERELSPIEGIDGHHNAIGGYSCSNCHDQGCYQCESGPEY